MDGQGLIGRKFIFCLFFHGGVGWFFVCGNRKRQTRRRRSTVRGGGNLFPFLGCIFLFQSTFRRGFGNAKKDGKKGKKIPLLPVSDEAAFWHFLLLLLLFLSAAKPTDQGEEGVVLLLVVVVVGGFGGTVFGSPMYTQNGCIQRKLFFKLGASRENFPLKWVYPEKLFFKMGVSRETFL